MVKPFRPHNVTSILRILVGVGSLAVLATAAFLPSHVLMPVVLIAIVLLAATVWRTTCTLDAMTLKQQKSESDATFERYLLRCLLDTLPDSIYFKDADSRFLRISKAQAERFGLKDPVEAIGKGDADFFDEAHARRTRADELHVMRTGQPLIGKEEKIVTPAAGERWVLTTKMPLRDPQGVVSGTFGVSRDITQLKRNEESLRQGEERYRSLVEATTSIVWNTPASGEFEEEQLGWSAFTGQTFDQLRGWGWLDAVHPDDRPNTAKVWSHAVATRSLYEVEHRLRARDGDYRHMLVRAVPILGRDGNIREWIGVHTDIDTERRAETALREAREAALGATRAKSEFLANMSHEIRTPLNGILGMAELLLHTDLTAGQREYLELLKTSADHLLTVINDILDFSKIEAGKLELEAVPFDLREVIDDTVASMASRVPSGRIELVHRIAPDVPLAVEGDPHRIRQVVANLLGNAIKFTERGEILLEIEPAIDTSVHAMPPAPTDSFELHFRVRDTGIGIPPQVQSKLFQAFSQADTSTTRRFGGTGLGLAISSRLVQLMGGRIWLESEAGQGSTFHFTARFRPAEPLAKPRAEPAALHGLRVLIVDDNATNRRILVEMVTNWNMLPTDVDSGAAAMETLLQSHRDGTPFHLVLLDAMMPKMDGFTLAETIRATPNLSGTIVMMLSSAGLHEDSARCRRMGINAYLTKPVRQSLLLDQIMIAIAAATPRKASTDRPGWTPTSRKLRILLAEDNLVNQRLTVAVLAQRGHDVVVVGNGRLALETLGRERFDAVLMDVQMPEMDGLEAASAIRAREWVTGTHTPIIAMTAHAMMGDREQCLAAGMDGYIAKPVAPLELFALIESLVPAERTEESPEPVAPSVTTASSSGKEILGDVLDWDTALARMLGDPEFLREMAGTFLQECPRWMADLGSAIATGNATGVRLVSHTLHGALTALAVKGAEPPARKLESMGRAGVLANSDQTYAELTVQIGELSRALKEFTRTAAPNASEPTNNGSDTNAQGTSR